MTVPVVKALALARPDLHITVVSRPFAKAFYQDVAENVEFVSLDLKQPRYKGIMGPEHVYQDLRSLNPDMVADLHDVLRTKYARMRFRMAGISVAHIDKHRAGRKSITRQDNKVLVQQQTSFSKYAQVFCKLGIDFNLPQPSAPDNLLPHIPSALFPEPVPMVGIAPFAAHKGKIYPVKKMERVIEDLRAAHPNLRILLFGGGKRDKEVFDAWCQKYPNVVFASEQCNGMREELEVMSRLKCMLSMDSGNMHMASLVGVPVVSIWGATHPYAGFMGWGQSESDVVQVSLPCRPCSIYGNKPCMRDDYACLNMIATSDIVKKIEKYI